MRVLHAGLEDVGQLRESNSSGDTTLTRWYSPLSNLDLISPMESKSPVVRNIPSERVPPRAMIDSARKDRIRGIGNEEPVSRCCVMI